MTIRYVALGDSFTEGVGDPDANLPNGVRGWADRVAEALAAREPDVSYANLAIRGRKMRQVLDEQIGAALALDPTLVSIYAGGNDILRPSVDVDDLVDAYEAALTRLTDAGVQVLVFTGFDTGRSAMFKATRGRTAIYNELIRKFSDRIGATIVDYWRFDEYNNPLMWDVDRLHMSTKGHINMAARVLQTISDEHVVELTPVESAPIRRRIEAMRADAAWAREYLAPWVGRRLTGRSSGDGMQPRWPELRQLSPG